MTTSNPSNDSNQFNINPDREPEAAGQKIQKRPFNFSPAGTIQYRYALDVTGKSVDVLSLKRTEDIAGRPFHCLGCGEPMIARLGDQLAHHFAHKSNSQCSGETYLHQLAKQVFYEEFTFCQKHRKPFQIELMQKRVCNHHGAQSAAVCQTRPKLQVYDLVPAVAALKVEKKADAFVPDITLVGKDDLWIEFAVSHPCSAAKLKSKHRIIEIRIASEADVALFRQHKLSGQDQRVKFIHFPDSVPEDLCRWYSHCRLAKQFIAVYPDGKLDIRYGLKNAVLPAAVKEKAVWWTEEFVHAGDEPVTEAEYDSLIRDAALRWEAAVCAAGHQIRACNLCRHFDRQDDAGCLKFQMPVPWHEAIKCEAFDPSIPEE